jgi:fructose-1,6-bisphosphatase/inositol monophosphatase family enzyme
MATSSNKISVSRKEAARRLVKMVEEHFDETGLSERERKTKTQSFAKNVDKAVSAAVRQKRRA